MRRVRGVAALLAAVTVLLSGCAVAADPDWAPPGWGATEIVRTSVPEPIDPGSVASLVGERLRNDAVGVQARWMQLPGAAPLNDRLIAVVREAIGAREAATGGTYSPQVFPIGAGMADRRCVAGSTLRPAGELLTDPAMGVIDGTGTAVVCDLVAAAGPVLGQRMRVVSGTAGAAESDVSAVLYADVTTGAVATAAELWTADAAAQLWTRVVELLRREAGALSLAPVAAPDEATVAGFAPVLATTLPAPDGALVITVPAGFTAPELEALGATPPAEPLVLAVPPGLAATLTAPVGAALVAAAGGAFQAPAPVPAGREPIDCDLLPCVALTYDDGPGELTGGVLDALSSRHAAATFFVLGQRARAWGDTLRRMTAEGHEVENHSWNHPTLSAIPLPDATKQLRDTNAAIEAETGEKVTMFRPPYGEYNAAVLGAAGMPAILWDIDTLDWRGVDDETLIRHAVDESRPGSIVLQHDIHPNTGRTPAAIYDGLLDRGFSLVTVTQLFGGEVPASGAWRSGR